MPRLFEIIPTTASIRHEDGSVEYDDTVMYLIEDDAEKALDAILKPYGEIGAFYLDRMQAKSPGPWAYIALRQEYSIAEYIFAQRDMLGGKIAFTFTIYDDSVDIITNGPIPKVACFLFSSKNAVQAAAEKIRFLEPAWRLLREMSSEKHWLVLLDEDPELILAEARER